jgi:hypothetical protein
MKTYTFDGKTYTTLPDPLKTAGGEISPMSEKLFMRLGGEIHDDGQPTPEEAVCGEFAELIMYLAKKTDKITPEEFLVAAQNGISSNLITLARSRGVSEEVIAEGRTRIVEIMADALRYGMTWNELIQGVMPK